MSLNKQKILKIFLTTNSKKEILEFIKNGLKKDGKIDQKSIILVTPNPEQVVLARKNSHFRGLLNQADVAIPDGIGLVLAYRFLGFMPQIERVTGVALMEDLVRQAGEEDVTIGLIGGWGQVAVEAFECLRQKYPRVRGWAIGAPEFGIKKNYELGMKNGRDGMDEYFSGIVQKIQETHAQMIFVGLGAPKQEYFIEKLQLSLRASAKQSIKKIATLTGQAQDSSARSRDDMTPILLMAVGGSFDEISGKLVMPSKFIERYGLKWLWRLILEPWRWRRQLALLEFIWLVIKEKLLYI